MLTSFCRNVHTFLGFSENPEGLPTHRNRHLCPNSSSSDDKLSGGLSLITSEVENPKNVLEASALKHAGKDAHPVSKLAEKPAILDCYDHGFGLRSCTESLGFESSEMMVTSLNEDKGTEKDLVNERSRSPQRGYRRKMVSKTEVKFPPPLSSMCKNGQRCYFLRSVRKEGRFTLTEMKKIDRPEILRVSREDGRLGLWLVKQEKSSQHGETFLKKKKNKKK